jgi:hypothetical protein
MESQQPIDQETTRNEAARLRRQGHYWLILVASAVVCHAALRPLELGVVTWIAVLPFLVGLVQGTRLLSRSGGLTDQLDFQRFWSDLDLEYQDADRDTLLREAKRLRREVLERRNRAWKLMLTLGLFGGVSLGGLAGYAAGAAFGMIAGVVAFALVWVLVMGAAGITNSYLDLS